MPHFSASVVLYFQINSLTASTYNAKIDHSWDYMIAEAFEIHNMWKADGWDAAAKKCKEYNFSSVYQSRAIRQRASKPETERMIVAAFRVGSIGFTAGTYEMFSEAGIYIKENSPYAYTFILTGNSGYIPSDKAFNYRVIANSDAYSVKERLWSLAKWMFYSIF